MKNDKQFWVFEENKNLLIIDSLIKRYGGKTPIIKILKKFKKNKLILK